MPNPGDTYEYKCVFYTVLSVSDEVLAQYEDEWYPTVRYCRSEEIVHGQSYIRTDVEFREKFRRV